MNARSEKSPLILDGKKLAALLRQEMSLKVKSLTDKGCKPGLGVILVGEDPSSKIYVSQKEKACQKLGINSFTWRLPDTVSQDRVLSLIDDINGREDIHAFLVQLPLPPHIDPAVIIEAIDPDKDADGLHPINIGRMLAGRDALLPCTPHGIMKLLWSNNIKMSGREAVIIGRSNIVGKPMSLLLLRENATVTICHSKTADLAMHASLADILVVAAGVPGLVNASMIKEGAVVVDVGTNRGADGKLSGDVLFNEACTKAAAITPVPGGVGPMTITMLLYNTILCAEKTAGAPGK